jgi:hypothetical protein
MLARQPLGVCEAAFKKEDIARLDVIDMSGAIGFENGL